MIGILCVARDEAIEGQREMTCDLLNRGHPPALLAVESRAWIVEGCVAASGRGTLPTSQSGSASEVASRAGPESAPAPSQGAVAHGHTRVHLKPTRSVTFPAHSRPRPAARRKERQRPRDGGREIARKSWHPKATNVACPATTSFSSQPETASKPHNHRETLPLTFVGVPILCPISSPPHGRRWGFGPSSPSSSSPASFSSSISHYLLGVIRLGARRSPPLRTLRCYASGLRPRTLYHQPEPGQPCLCLARST